MIVSAYNNIVCRMYDSHVHTQFLQMCCEQTSAILSQSLCCTTLTPRGHRTLF